MKSRSSHSRSRSVSALAKIHRDREQSVSVSHRGDVVLNSMKSGFECCGCWLSGNAMSLLSAAFLFALITGVQYFYALIGNSVALQADCISMAVDSLSFLGNLFAECASGPNKRAIQLTMSGISHFLLLGFTVKFIKDGVDILQGEAEDDVNGWIVFGFALGGLLFDAITLIVYRYYGDRASDESDVEAPLVDNQDSIYDDAELLSTIKTENEDALTCGINTNMCAALLHVLSDMGRSTTTLVESLVIILVPSIPGNKVDGISALIICTIIAIGSSCAICVWLREVYVYVTTPSEHPLTQSVRDPDKD